MRNGANDTLKRQELPLWRNQGRRDHRVGRHVVVRVAKAILVPTRKHTEQQRRQTHDGSVAPQKHGLEVDAIRAPKHHPRTHPADTADLARRINQMEHQEVHDDDHA